jgi:hypothetical protein
MTLLPAGVGLGAFAGFAAWSAKGAERKTAATRSAWRIGRKLLAARGEAVVVDALDEGKEFRFSGLIAGLDRSPGRTVQVPDRQFVGLANLKRV